MVSKRMLLSAMPMVLKARTTPTAEPFDSDVASMSAEIAAVEEASTSTDPADDVRLVSLA